MNRWIKTVALMMLVAIMGAVVMMPSSSAAQTTPTNLLTDIPVRGTLENGGRFVGTLDITGFAVENGQLLVSGVLEGTARQGNVVTQITQTFTNVVADLLQPGGGQGGGCQILFLDIGPIFLDLLGLQVDLSQIVLDITAVPGAGNLLGNLLCAVAGLLDGGLLGGGLDDILNDLIGIINDLLGGLNL